MNKKLSLLIVLLLFSVQLSAQSINQKADSLRLLIKNTTEDTTKAQHLITLGSLYVYNNPNEALKILHQALTFSGKIQSDESLASSYSFLFNVHDVLGSHSDSLMTYIKLLEQLNERVKSVRYDVKIHWNKAIYYKNFGQHDKIIEEYLKALELVRKNDLPVIEQARLLGNIGNTFDTNGDYEEALKYYKQSAPLFDNNKMGTAITYFNMGVIYSRKMNQLDTAINLLNKTYDIVEELEHHSLMAAVLIEQGYCYDFKEKYDRANQLYKQALQISEAQNLGENFIKLHDTYAGHYFKRKQYELAIKYSDKGIKMSQEREDNSSLKSLYEVQEKSYVELGNYKKAYDVKSSLMIHLDSLNSTELQGKFKELQTKYDVDQKELENELLKAETEITQKTLRSRNAIAIGLIAVLLLVAGWSFFIYRNSQQRKKHNEILEQKVSERTKDLKQANYELRTFSYIASHDIKEPIRNIGNYAGLIFRKLPVDLKSNLGDYFDTIKRSTTQLYTLIEDFARYTTMSQDETIVSQTVDLNQLFENVIDNLHESIQKYNGQVIVPNLPIIKSIDSLLFTTFKNLIENGLKYNQSEKPTINVDYQKTATHHEITISDNGIGINEEYHEQIFEMFKRLHDRSKYEGSGIGLAIVKLSIDKIGGNLKLESEENKGSRFIIQLPK